MKAVELFCGGGLMALGLVRAGCKLVGACDVWGKAVDCFNHSSVLPPVASCTSVTELRPIPCDVVSGGPVCKAFSKCSYWHGSVGDKDARNTFPDYIDYVKRARPLGLILENSFHTKRYFPYFWSVLDMLKGLGYHITAREIDAFNYGVPQHRHRVVAIGHLKGKRDFPLFTRQKSDPRVVGDCLYPLPPADLYSLLKPLSRSETEYYYRDPHRLRRHRPVTEREPCRTITSAYGNGVPNGLLIRGNKLYRIGPRLAARLQGLPDEYRLPTDSFNTGLRIFGNGLPPQVSRVLAEALM